MNDDAYKTAADYLQLGKRHWIDDNPKPDWGDGPDGRRVKITGDVRFTALWQEWVADACHHERKGIVHWVNAGGQQCYNWYCGHCGLKLGPNIPRLLAEEEGFYGVALDALASRTNAYVAERKKRLDDLVRAAAERAQPGNREEYDDYLRSERWRQFRSLILRRAGGSCEGCLSAPAEHIHHLTYAHRGAEFAFELIALCAACHERIHEQEVAE